MPRRYGKKGDNDEDDFVVSTKHEDSKPENIVEPEMATFIEQLQQEHQCWVRKKKMLHCSVCSVNVQFSSLIVLKNEIINHMKSKRHKKKIEFHNLEKDSKTPEDSEDVKKTDGTYVKTQDEIDSTDEIDLKKPEERCDVTNNKEDDKNTTRNKKENKLSGMLRKVEQVLSHKLESTDNRCKKIKRNKHQLVDFDTVYDSLDKDNPVTKMSKGYIVKEKEGHFYCKICEDVIFDSLNSNELRFNLWCHINNENHRERLPNFSKVERDFKKLTIKLSIELPPNLKSDLKYLEIGPVFRFFKCSICKIAVSENFHRLQNHFNSKQHQSRKQGDNIKPLELPSSIQTRNWYARYINDMYTNFEGYQLLEDFVFLHMGSTPGYVICSLCSHVVLPTPYYLQEHFQSDKHVNNKTANLIKWESAKTCMTLCTAQSVLDHDIFEETIGGMIKCHRCKCLMPSYKLYRHIKTFSCGMVPAIDEQNTFCPFEDDILILEHP